MNQLSTADVAGHRIEYRLIGGSADAAVILHGGHMSARCTLGEATYLELGRSAAPGVPTGLRAYRSGRWAVGAGVRSSAGPADR